MTGAPVSVSAGPTSLPSSPTLWHFAHVPAFAKIALPRVASPRRLTSSPIAGSVKKGELLEASSQRGDWLEVKAGAKAGWTHRTLVE